VFKLYGDKKLAAPLPGAYKCKQASDHFHCKLYTGPCRHRTDNRQINSDNVRPTGLSTGAALCKHAMHTRVTQRQLTDCPVLT